MNITAFIIFLFGLQFLCLWIGGRTSKNQKSKSDYFLAGKTVKFFPLMMTFLATQVGGGLILGSTEEAYKYGWFVLFYPLGATLGLIALGTGIGKRLAQFQVSTTAQLFEVVYRSALLKKTASVLSMISMFMMLIAQIIASNKFMVSVGVDNQWIFISFWGIVIVYTVLGGFKAIVDTDIVQATLFLFTFLFVFCYIFATSDISVMNNITHNSSNVDASSKLFGWLFMTLLYTTIEQDITQRCFAGASPKIVSKAAFYAGVCTLVCAIPVFLGVYASKIGLIVPEGSSVLMTIISHATNPIITALVGCAIFAAIISTADSLLNAISANLSQDFNLPVWKEKDIRLSQLITTLIAIGAIFSSYYFNNVVDMLLLSYELSVCCLFVPVFFVLFKKDGNTLSAMLSVGFGMASYLFFKFFPVSFPKELICLTLSCFGFGLGEFLSRKTAKAPAL